MVGDAALRKVVGADALGAVAAADQRLARRGLFACCSRICLSLMRAASTAIARALFLCCERSSWHSTTMPVGRWVMRTAESVLLTCWPPAPDDAEGIDRAARRDSTRHPRSRRPRA